MPAKGQAMSLEQRHLRSRLMSGEGNHRWRGGKTMLKNGYVALNRRGHPMASTRGTLLEHRLVLAEHIGRELTPGEQVHHVNETRSDNRIVNLWLFPDNAAHTEWHLMVKLDRSLARPMAAVPLADAC